MDSLASAQAPIQMAHVIIETIPTRGAVLPPITSTQSSIDNGLSALLTNYLLVEAFQTAS